MRKKIFIVIVLGLVFQGIIAHAQQWIQKYDGPDHMEDAAQAIAIDSMGNVYVTGISYSQLSSDDYNTIKYSADGKQQWVQRYDGPEESIDWPCCIAVDKLGNVYVTGWSRGLGTGNDYATIKYNSLGIQQWVKRYDDSSHLMDWAQSLAVDDTGNVYVTGYGYDRNSGVAYITIKYNRLGAEQWVRRYNGNSNTGAEAFSLAVDKMGNVYVTGVGSDSNGTGAYTTTIKYNSSGVQLWVARHVFLSTGNFPRSLVLDDSANVYVVATSYHDSITKNDYETIKYNTDGIEQWSQWYNGPASLNDYAYSIAVDKERNVFVTGYSTGIGTGKDYATIKYNTNGVQQWVARYNGPGNGDDIANSVKVDNAGNVYVTGYSTGSGTGKDCTTIKYDPDGVRQWLMRYNGGGNGSDVGNALAVDDSGSVYVTGYSTTDTTGNIDFVTIKYTPSTVRVTNEVFPQAVNEINIYPHPFTSSTTLLINSELLLKNAEVILYDLFGREVKRVSNVRSNKIRIDRGNLLKGIYFYRVSDGGTIIGSGKIIVE